jgi:hypothetical protein
MQLPSNAKYSGSHACRGQREDKCGEVTPVGDRVADIPSPYYGIYKERYLYAESIDNEEDNAGISRFEVDGCRDQKRKDADRIDDKLSRIDIRNTDRSVVDHFSVITVTAARGNGREGEQGGSSLRISISISDCVCSW